VRSGVVTSVHAFANDPARGTFILLILVLAIGGALALFAWRAPRLEEGSAFETVSRESALLLNNVLLVGAVAIVFVGTIYPIALSALGVRLSVGPPYFNALFVPLFLALLVLVPFGPRMAWRKASLPDAFRVLRPAVAAALLAGLIVLALKSPRTVGGTLAFAIASWLIASSVIDLLRRHRLGAISSGAFAAALAHAGLGVSLAGIAATTLWRSESLEVLGPGETMTVGGYSLQLASVDGVRGPNYLANRASIVVRSGGDVVAIVHPERRIYPAEGQETVVTSIRTTGIGDLYVALGDRRERGHWIVRAYANPLAPFIWLGAGVMALGGLASLQGRLRRQTMPQAGAIDVPASS
jgi:cytochrome c-type biogenesis protein CcmF